MRFQSSNRGYVDNATDVVTAIDSSGRVSQAFQIMAVVDVGIEIIGSYFLANEGPSFYIFSRGVKPFAILLYKTTGLKMDRLMVGVICSCHLISACQYLAMSESKST